ncbi:glycosyltransferase family 39 protein [Pleurocapsa sp. PCC 7319]|uniref:ArnT family glycosyltransferase n=1 Tax=Pleurocapsa sp. PCC 7319 TaxID=118161 RepID=UPI00036D4F6E|nr:glycosyltransferase family 39 protein [Pleurocapsa sp. PCC 7319]
MIMVFGIGDYGLYEPHEGHFAMVGQEMIFQGNWITPHLNGSPYLNKPPLLYWLIAFSTKVFGAHEFAARLPIGLAGWLGILIAWKWTRQLWGVSASRIAALMLSVTVGWFLFTHQILIDVLLSTLLLASNYFLWRVIYQPQSWVYWWAAYISLGLCLLTKGLIGIVFPLLGFLVLGLVRQDRKLIRRLRLFRGSLLVLALILPWFIAVEQANPGFWHYFVVNEHLDRLLDRRFPPDYEVSQISAFGYLIITALWCFPGILFLPSVLKFTWQEWRQGFRDRASTLERQYSDGILLLAIAAILPVIFFLPFSSRLIYYGIPAIPPYVILFGGWYSRYQTSVSEEQSDQPLAISIKQSYLPANFREKKRNKVVTIYSAIAICLGICFVSTLFFHSLIVQSLPPVINNSDTKLLMFIVPITLGLGWIISGIGIVRQSRFALLPVFLALIVTYISVVQGFIAYQDVRSSKTLIRAADSCLNIDTLWIFEGSREIGTAGAISYYLNQGQNYNAKDIAEHHDTGWEKGNSGRIYRHVMVLSDGGKNRIPPNFPGSPPAYLIDRQQLQSYWNSDRPVVFITDFLRQFNDLDDPENRNLPQGVGKPSLIINNRKLYLNAAAQKFECNF